LLLQLIPTLAPFCFTVGHASFGLRALKIYIDDSCRKNPDGPGSFAARIEYPFEWVSPHRTSCYQYSDIYKQIDLDAGRLVTSGCGSGLEPLFQFRLPKTGAMVL